jgi:hypothetical protein
MAERGPSAKCVLTGKANGVSLLPPDGRGRKTGALHVRGA